MQGTADQYARYASRPSFRSCLPHPIIGRLFYVALPAFEQYTLVAASLMILHPVSNLAFPDPKEARQLAETRSYAKAC